MTPAQQAVLANEIQVDPLAMGYATHLPNGIGNVLSLLNNQTEKVVKTRMVTARAVLAEVAGSAVILDKLEAAAASNIAVKWAVRFLGNEGGLDVGNPVTQGMIDTLVDGSVLTPVEGAALKNMARQWASRAEILGLGSVTMADVMKATNMPRVE